MLYINRSCLKNNSYLYTAQGSTSANSVYSKIENSREMTTDTILDLEYVTKVTATTHSSILLHWKATFLYCKNKAKQL